MNIKNHHIIRYVIVLSWLIIVSNSFNLLFAQDFIPNNFIKAVIYDFTLSLS